MYAAALLRCTTLLQAAAAKQERPCKQSNVSDWAFRASEPHTQALPDTQQLPAPPVYLPQHNGSCNSYLPDTDGLGRLLWTVQYFVANGFYVTVRGTGGNCQLDFLQFISSAVKSTLSDRWQCHPLPHQRHCMS